jgi:uncharacterized membrane protein (UPF0127 family)
VKIGLRILLFSLLFFQCSQSNSNRVKEKKITFKKEGVLSIVNSDDDLVVEFDIELAETPYERETGLMYRNELHENNGMLFLFDTSELRGFYMKNTLLTLDLLFVNSAFEIVHIHKNATPFDTKTISSEVPVQYVLEIKGGLSDKFGIQKQMKIKFNRNE